jgi:hypothetical protein
MEKPKMDFREHEILGYKLKKLEAHLQARNGKYLTKVTRHSSIETKALKRLQELRCLLDDLLAVCCLPKEHCECDDDD